MTDEFGGVLVEDAPVVAVAQGPGTVYGLNTDGANEYRRTNGQWEQKDPAEINWTAPARVVDETVPRAEAVQTIARNPNADEFGGVAVSDVTDEFGGVLIGDSAIEKPGTFTTLGNEFKAAAAKGVINTVGGVARALSNTETEAESEQVALRSLQARREEVQKRLDDPNTKYGTDFLGLLMGKPTAGVSKEYDQDLLAGIDEDIKGSQENVQKLLDAQANAPAPNAVQRIVDNAGSVIASGAGQVADVMEAAIPVADEIYNANPNDTSIPAQIGRGAGTFFSMAPTMIGTGGLGLAAGVIQGASQSYAEGFNNKVASLRASGVTDPRVLEAEGHHAGSVDAVKTAPALGVYFINGRLASNAVGALFKDSAPLVQGIAGGTAATVANMASGSLIRAAEGQDPRPNFENATMDSLFGFGIHGVSTGMDARRKMVDLNPKGESKQPASTKPKGLGDVKVEQAPAGMTPLSEILPADAAGKVENLKSQTPASNLGPAFPQFSGKPQEAFDHLMQQKDGYVPEALSHPEIGGVDVIWGKDTGSKATSYGLAKLAAYHPEMLHVLPELFSSFKLTKQNDNTAHLKLGPYTAIVRKNWLGNEQHWLLTAFEKGKGDSTGKTIDSSGSPSQEREAGKLSSQNRTENVPPIGENVNPEAGMKKPEANPEGGFVVADVPQGIVDFGRSIYRAGMDFAEWSGRMVRELGESVRGHLENLWKALKEHFTYLPHASERGGIGSKTDDLGKRDPEFENAVAEAAKDPEKRRKFIQSVKDAEAVMPEVKERVESIYEPISNKATGEEARAWINEKGLDGALADLLAVEAPTARDVMAGLDLMGRLQAGGRFEDASVIAEHMAERSTDQGQAIQALSNLAKLGPEGIQIYAHRQVQKAVKASPEMQRRYGDIAKLKGELRKSRDGMAAQATIHAEAAGGENVQVRIHRMLGKQAGSLWGRYKQGAVGELERKIMGPDRPRDLVPLEAFTLRLKRNLMDQLPPALRKRAEAAPEDQAALLGEAVRNFDKYKEVWDETQRQVQETYKGNPEALQALDDYFGQILKRPFSEKSLGKAVRQVMDEMNLQIKQVLAQGIGDKAKSKAAVAKVIVERSGLHGDEATALAAHISKHFETLQQGARDAMLRQMTQMRSDRVKRSTLQRLMEQNNAGVLDDQRFFGALAKQYGIPVWTPELSARVQKLQREYEGEKNPKVKLAKAAQMLDTVHEMIPSDIFTKARAVMNLAMLLNPKTVIRNIGGNQAMWVADVTADSLSRWVVDPAVSIVTGDRNRTRRSVDIGARLSGFAEPVRDFWDGYGSARDAGATKAASAAEGVRTILTLGSLGRNHKYDLADINRGNAHIFSSQFGRLFENTLTLMLSIPDRGFHQAAFQGSVIRQMKLAEVRGEKLVSPTPEMLQEAAMDGARAIFEDKNFVSASLSEIGKALNKATTLGKSDRYGLGAVMLPFTQIPGSIAVRGVEWTPLGFIRPAYELLRPLTGRDFRQKEFVDSFSRALLGSGIAATGYWLAHLGIVSAVGEEDKDLEAMRKDAGYGKYRINRSALNRTMMSANWWTKQQAQPGDVMVNYDWLQPIAMPVAMGAEIYHQQEMQRLDASQGKASAVPPSLRAFAAGGFAALKTLEDQPLLTGITRAARDIGQDGIGKGLAKQALAAPGMFVPTVLSQVSQLFDNKMRVTSAGSPVDQAVAQIMTKIPGLAEKYPVKYGAFGEAQERYQYGGNSFFNVMLNPAFVTRVKSNPALQEIERVYAATGDKGVIPNKAPVKLQIAGQSVELTNEQISQYQRTAGLLTVTAYSRLAASPQFAAAPVGAKAVAMDRVMTAISNMTKLLVLKGNPDLVRKIVTQKQQQVQAKRVLMTTP